MKKKGLMAVLALSTALISVSSAYAGGDSVPVYTSYDIPAAPAPLPMSQMAARTQTVTVHVVPAVAYQSCCCDGNIAFAMNVGAGGQVFTTTN